MSEITSRFISLYPTAVVRRNPIPDPDPGLTEDSLSSKARHICIYACACAYACVCVHMNMRSLAVGRPMAALPARRVRAQPVSPGCVPCTPRSPLACGF